MNKQEITSKIKEITETGAVCGVDVYVCLKGEEQGFYIEKMISMNSLKDRIRSIIMISFESHLYYVIYLLFKLFILKSGGKVIHPMEDVIAVLLQNIYPAKSLVLIILADKLSLQYICRIVNGLHIYLVIVPPYENLSYLIN